MKTLITIIAVLSFVFLLYDGQKSRQEVSALLLARNVLDDTLDARSKQLEKRNKEYESLATNYATLKEELDKVYVSGDADKNPITPVEVSGNPSKQVVTTPTEPTTSGTPLDTRLQLLKNTYDKYKAELDRKKAALEDSMQNAKDSYEQLLRNTPKFKEQGVRRDSLSNVIGGKGIRTSDADRAREEAKHDRELEQWKAYIETTEAAQDTLSDEYKTLEEKYAKAVREAKELK